MAFFLFLLVNATLFLRPAEVFPGLETVRIYETLIIACFLLGFPQVIHFFSTTSLENSPITLGIFGLLGVSGFSNIVQGYVEQGLESYYSFFKLVIYYLLLVGLINTPARLRTFLVWLGFCVLGLALVSLGRYYEIIELQRPTILSEKDLQAIQNGQDPGAATVIDFVSDPVTGMRLAVHRLKGTGIFADPNDLCVALCFGILLCLFGIIHPTLGMFRFFCLIPAGIFLYTMVLTHSRGGFLGVFLGLLVLFGFRYGLRRAVLLMVLMLPVALPVLGPRFLEASVSGGTGQTRVQMWRDGLLMLKQSPLWGVGMDHYSDQAGQVAHNSFIHMYAELGFPAGTIFLGMFFYAFWALGKLHRSYILDSESRRLLPFFMALIAGYGGGLMTLSLCYVVPTYTMLGLVTAFLRVTPTYPRQVYPLTGPLVGRIFIASLAFLACMFVFVRLFAGG